MQKTFLSAVCVFLVTTLWLPGCSSKPDPEMVAAYKTFADLMIVQDYPGALPHAAGPAAALIEPKTKKEMFGRVIQIKPGGFGTIEGSTVDVVRSMAQGNQVKLDIVYRASISWEGSTANPMSPGSWKTFNQKATLEKVGGAWKIIAFSGDGFEAF